MKKTVNQLKSKLQFHRIRSRFLAGLIALSVPPIFLIGIIAYQISADTLVDNQLDSYQQQLSTFDEGVDMVFSNIIKMNRYILSDEDIRQQLVEMNANLEQQQRTSIHLQSIMSEYLIEQKYVESICLLDNQFHVFCYGRSDNAGIYEGENKAVSIQESSWYREALAARGREKFISYNVLEPQHSDTFSSVKWMLDPENLSLEPIGMLIVNINESMFSDVMNLNDNNELLILDDSEEPNYIYSSSPQFREIGIEGNLAQVFESVEGEGYLYSTNQNETTGWTFIHLVEEEKLLQEPRQIRGLTFFIATLIALTAIALSVFLSGTITSPLLKIKKMMISWSRGKTEFKETFPDDEVGVIGETFKQIAAENKELSERLTRSELKERETELRVLQAQINPHFLYNTLDSIYWMAVMNGHQDIGKMAISLSESFKIILSKGEKTIPISEELKHIEHYMTIQNLRHGGRFEYIQKVDPSLLDTKVLKLLLQPLIENAIYHGLETKVGKGEITLTGKKENGLITFEVVDNGIGMKDTNVIKEGYGLRNIQERLHLFYGSDSLFEIKSEPNKGTAVKISFFPEEEGRGQLAEGPDH